MYNLIVNQPEFPGDSTSVALSEKEIAFFLSVTEDGQKELLSRYFPGRDIRDWIILTVNGLPTGQYNGISKSHEFTLKV